MSINDSLRIVWEWCIPPLDQRSPHTIFSFLTLLGIVCLPTIAAYINIFHPELKPHWKALYIISLIPIIFRACFAHYTHWNAYDEPSSIWGNGDAYIGGCALSILIFSMDFLFLARKDEQKVLHADEYSKWMLEKQFNGVDTNNGNANGADGQRDEIEKIAGGKGYTLEQPKYFPGTKAWLPFDMAMGPRCQGYVRGQSQKGCPYEAGYRALIASEKLQMLPKEREKEVQTLKRKHLFRIGRELCYSILISDLMMAILNHPSLIGISRYMNDNNKFMFLSEATRSSTLGRCLTTWLSTLLLGASIPLRMQMLHLIVYFFALLFTPAKLIPITVSRYEPLLCPNFASCTSIQALWSQGWHQLPRRMYTVIAMRPMKRLANRLQIDERYGRAMGYLISFFISGIIHEMSLEALLGHIPHINKQMRSLPEHKLRMMGYGFGAKGFASTRFFVVQAIIILVEEFWLKTFEPCLSTKLLGKGTQKLIDGRLRTILGWLWCPFWMTLPGIAMIDVWTAHGIMCPITDSIIFSPLLDLLISH